MSSQENAEGLATNLSTPSVSEENESEIVVKRPLTDDAPSVVLLEALAETDLELTETKQSLSEQVDTDALDILFDDPTGSVQFSTVVWNHPILMTADAVVVFEEQADDDNPMSSTHNQ